MTYIKHNAYLPGGVMNFENTGNGNIVLLALEKLEDTVIRILASFKSVLTSPVDPRISRG